MPKYAVVIVIYYPDEFSLQNVRIVANLCSKIILIDNSDIPIHYDFDRYQNIHLIKNNKNLGISEALNIGVKCAGKMGYENIFLLDQDTRIEKTYFLKMLKFQKELKKKNYAFCVPNFFDRNSRTYARFPVLKKIIFQHKRCPFIDKIEDGEMILSITSGTLLKYSRYIKIGPFERKLFIDLVDNEYCLKAFSKGYFVAVNCEAIINHSIGNRTKKKILNHTFKPTYHDAKRRYYFARNGIVISIKYFTLFHSFLFLITMRIINEFLSILLFENKKNKKVKGIMYGIIDGMLRKTGECRHKFLQE